MTWDLVAAYLLGVVTGWLIYHREVVTLRQELRRAHAAETVATDRLVHAWKDGATIPPRPAEPVPPPLPLPKELLEYVAQWEDPEHRAMLEARFRAEMGAGKGATAILMALDNEHP